MARVQIGEITHYFNRIGVAVVSLTGDIRVGDVVHILGRLTDFQQQVTSLQIEHQSIQEAGAGQEVAIKVSRPVRPRDKVYRITEET
jgi:selenocysteine-specific translation elongation factor